MLIPTLMRLRSMYAATILVASFTIARPSAADDIEFTVLRPSGETVDAAFGLAVAISKDYAIVGAPGIHVGTGNGSAYVFRRYGNGWAQEAKLTARDGARADGFGWQVALSEDCALVGTIESDGVAEQSGAAYLFRRHGTAWVQEAKLTASDGRTGDVFGCDLSP